MNIYFDYDVSINNKELSKKLSAVLMRVKQDILSHLDKSIPNYHDVFRKAEKDGFILVTIKPNGNAKKVFGFDDTFRNTVAEVFKKFDLEKSIRDGFSPFK